MDLLYNIPVKENKPIGHMPQNKEWRINVGTRLIVENTPPVRRVYINHILVSEYKIGDAESERIAVVHTFLNGIGKQKELAEIWGVHYNTINNYVAAYRKLGFKGLTDLYYQPEVRRQPVEEKTVIIEDQDNQISFFEQETSERVYVSDEQDSIPVADSQPETTQDVISTDDQVERTVESKYGGNMLFYPFITEMYEDIMKEVQTIDNKINSASQKIFKLKQILLSLIFYVFAGISNPEAGKTVLRKEFGVLIGESASPCCKTLRKGLNMLTVENFPAYIIKELTRQYVKLKYVELGTLYVDGHFIPYYGKMNVHKGYSTQRRIAMPGHYQNWANDKNGRPIFFYVNNSFVKFSDVIKYAVSDTLKLMEEAGIDERLIVVFDRGAYDGNLFRELDRMGVGFITWQKGKKQCEQSLLDGELSYKNREGKEIKYLAYKRKIDMKSYRDNVEAITVYDEATEKQSTLINNLEYVGIFDKSDSYKIKALDGRWAQENFFKEAKVREDIDHQMGYQFESEPFEGEDNEYYVVNPEYALLMEEIEQLAKRYNIYILKRKGIIKKFGNLKRKKPLRDYLKQKGNRKVLDTYRTIKIQLKEKRKKIVKVEPRVKYSELQEERKDILKTVRSSVILGIRASVYNMRKRFEEMAAECFADHRELSKFVLAITSSPAVITVTEKTYYVKLKKLETPVYQKSAEKLIEKLNKMNPMALDSTKRKVIYKF